MKKKVRFPLVGSLLLLVAIFFLIMGLSVIFVEHDIVPEVKRNMVILDKAEPLPENEGKLVLVRGNTALDERYITDPLFGITARAVMLQRKVFRYETVRDTVKNDEGEYEYHNIWTKSEKAPYPEETTRVAVRLGGFIVPEAVIEKLLAAGKDLEIDTEILSQHHMIVRETEKELLLQTNSEKTKYTEANIGDIQIRYTYVKPEQLETATILAEQKGNEFVEYISPKGARINEFWPEYLETEEVLKRIQGELNGAYIMALVLVLAFGIPGVLKIKNRMEEFKEAKNAAGA